MKTFWSYLTPEAAYRAQLAQVSLCPRAGGSEKTNDDLGLLPCSLDANIQVLPGWQQWAPMAPLCLEVR